MSPTIATNLLGVPGAAPDAARLGRRMAALYRAWDRGGIDLPALAACLVAPSGGDTPVGRLCLALAQAVARWGGHAYHSALHHAEVATNAAVLAELSRPAPSPPERALLLAAALAHDIHYLPRQARPRFAAEAASADAADALAAACGLAEGARDDLRTLILATEPGFRATLRCSPSDPAGLPPGLATLATRPALARLAALLSDADLLSSAGLTEGWHAVQRRRLEREMQHAVTVADERAFFEHIVGDGFLSPGGQHFTPNLDRIRQAACREPEIIASGCFA